MKKQERINRIIAKGEFSNHSHVITENADVIRNNKGEIFVEVKGECYIEHLLESVFVETGQKEWTKEHHKIRIDEKHELIRQGDVLLKKAGDNLYVFVQQMAYDPLSKRIEKASD